jgi:asparaginyl-tRNA synthetase
VVNGACPGFSAIMKDPNNGVGTSVFALGEIVPSSGREQKVEMNATEIRVLGSCNPSEYPLAGKGLTLEYLRTVGHLRPRTMVLGAVTRVRNALAMGTHNFFQKCG